MESLSAYNFQSQRLKRRRRKKLVKLLIYIFIGVIGMYFLFNHFMKKTPSLIENATSLMTSQSTAIPITTVNPQEISKPLKEKIAKALEGTNGIYGVVVRNLKTGETYSANEHRVFEAGSLYKLWTMTVVINQLESGELKEDKVLSQSVSVLNDKFDIEPELAEQTSGTVTFSVG